MGILIVRLTIILFLLCTPARAATYYVKDGGNDSLNGISDANAWATIAKVQATVTNGDTVYFRSQDTWESASDQVLNATTAGVSYDGSTYGTGTRATLKATGKLNAVVKLSASTLSFKGFNIDMNSQNTGGIHIGTYATSDVTGITVDDCKVHTSRIPSGSYNYGIHVGGYAAANVDVENVTITGTEVYDTGHEAFAIYPTWTKSGCTAKNVLIRNCSGHGAGIDGDSWGHGLYVVNAVENLTVEFSAFYGNDVGANIGTSLTYTGTPTGIVYRYNLIYSNTLGQVLLGPSDSTDGIQGIVDIYGNVIYGSAGSCIYVGGDWNTSTLSIFNNTVYSVSGGYYAFYIYNISGTPTINLKNNILVADNFYLMKFNAVNDESLVTHSNNLLYRITGSTNQWYIINDVPYTAANVKDTWDATSENTDPTFTGGSLPTGFTGIYGTDMVPNTTYFAITGGDALNNGATLGSPYDGCINGAGTASTITRPVGSAYDIGAYEYQGRLMRGVILQGVMIQ